jgi:O-succinylbenzoate synthase
VAHALVDTELRTAICLDETLRDARAARQILELDGPTVWNLKVHRVGGLTETCRIVRIAVEAGVSLWAGTMPESGLGSQAAIAAASLPSFVYPSDLEPSARWFGPGKDVIELTMSPDGLMEVPGRSIASLLDRDRFRAASRQIVALEGG